MDLRQNGNRLETRPPFLVGFCTLHIFTTTVIWTWISWRLDELTVTKQHKKLFGSGFATHTDYLRSLHSSIAWSITLCWTLNRVSIVAASVHQCPSLVYGKHVSRATTYVLYSTKLRSQLLGGVMESVRDLVWQQLKGLTRTVRCPAAKCKSRPYVTDVWQRVFIRRFPAFGFYKNEIR